MALINKLTAIADAIRSKTGKTGKLTLEQMASEIASIGTSGGGASFTLTFNIASDTATTTSQGSLRADLTPLTNYMRGKTVRVFQVIVRAPKGSDSSVNYYATGGDPVLIDNTGTSLRFANFSSYHKYGTTLGTATSGRFCDRFYENNGKGIVPFSLTNQRNLSTVPTTGNNIFYSDCGTLPKGNYVMEFYDFTNA